MEDNKSTTGQIVGKVLKYIIIALIILVYGGFMLRICTMGDPDSMKEYVWTEATIKLYNNYPDKFKVEKVNEERITYQHLTGNGSFAISNIFITDTGNNTAQIQFTVRYNNSTVKTLTEDYGLSEEPIGEPFIYIISDSYGNIYRSYQFTIDTKTVYNYRHVIFEDVDMTGIKNLVDEYLLSLDIYYIEAVNLLNTPYSTLPVFNCIYNADGDYIGYITDTYDIKKDLFSNNQPTSGIMVNPAYLVKDQ